ncbi:General transcription factor 3C polypeptide 2, partial [Aphis craccivora]
MDSNTVDVQLEVDDDQGSVKNFESTNKISHDSVVTCGKCKKQMLYQEYDSKHRQIHYDLCWILGVEDEIDFTNTSKTQEILKENTKKSKAKSKFICEWCDAIKMTISGFANHLNKCKQNPVLNVNNQVLIKTDVNLSTSSITYDDNTMVSCGRCGESMIFEEYKNKHKHTHYNLCWLEGEEKIDYLNEQKLVVLLRAILKNSTAKKKFICEWCKDLKKSVVGFASHVKKCAIEQKKSKAKSKFICEWCDVIKMAISAISGFANHLNKCKQNLVLQHPNETDSPESIEEEKHEDEEESNNKNNSMIICGRCNKSMTFKEYEDTHSATHYSLCWIKGDEKPLWLINSIHFDDENIVQYLLRQKLPKHAARQKKVKFVCEWCQIERKSVPGFASHVKRCQSRPDKVTCGRCKEEMTFYKYRTSHYSKHYNLCWIDGD